MPQYVLTVVAMMAILTSQLASTNSLTAAVDKACTEPVDYGPCDGYFPKYYYNMNSGSCEQFGYGGCGGNNNKFSTLAECQHRCEVQ